MSESGLREDLVKSAVSFLSSSNVQAADKTKKVAFLEKKGLTQAEIDEAFNRVGTAPTTATTTTPSTTTTSPVATSNPLPPPLPVQNHSLAPVLPARHTQPQVIYYPQPPPPPVSTGKVLAMAVILGIGAVGVTATIIGVLKRFIGRIFNRIANYQSSRYNERREFGQRLLTLLKTYNDENDDLDAVIDQGEEKSVADAIVKHQGELKDKMDALVKQARTPLESTTYQDFQSDLASFRSTIVGPTHDFYSGSFMRNNNDSPAVSGLKSDIRSLKAVLLNRRNFPTV